jgi:hypothetical protein
MNGRVYDPVLARFLSPDPVMQDPTNTQDYNKYTYCLNNPLSYTDPSGNVIIDHSTRLERKPQPNPTPAPINRLKSGQTKTASITNDEIMLAPVDRHPEDWDSDEGTKGGTNGTYWEKGVLYNYGSGWDGTKVKDYSNQVFNSNYFTGQGSFTGQIPATEHIINHDGYEYNPLTNTLTIYFSGHIFVYSNVTGYMTSIDGEVIKISLDNIDNCTAYGSNIYSSHGTPSSSQYLYDFSSGYAEFLWDATNAVVMIGGIVEDVFALATYGKEIISLFRGLIFIEGQSSRFAYIIPKIVKQMTARGWTPELIQDVFNNPYTTRVSFNKATGNAATAYYTKEGFYIVVDDVTNQVVQISDKLRLWFPDPEIIDPYIP